MATAHMVKYGSVTSSRTGGAMSYSGLQGITAELIFSTRSSHFPTYLGQCNPLIDTKR